MGYPDNGDGLDTELTAPSPALNDRFTEDSIEEGDIFDNIEALRTPQDYGSGSNSLETKVLNVIPIRRPGPQEYVRCHPDPAYSLPVLSLEVKETREHYMVVPALRAEILPELKNTLLTATMTRQGVLMLWPIRLPAADGRIDRWSQSAVEAAAMARVRWVRVKADMNLGAYATWTAEENLSDPEWPDVPFEKMLRIAFKGLVIDSMEHPVLRRLRGAE